MGNTYWDESASRYDAHTQKFQKMYDKMLSLIKLELTKDSAVLDIGTGTGEIPILLCNNAKEITGIDMSTSMIEIAKSKAQKYKIVNVSFSEQDSCRLKLDDNKYDVVIIANLLHIVEDNKKVISEARRVLRNDGKLIVATYLHGHSIKTRMISFILKLKGHPIYTRFSSKSIGDLLKVSGFEINKQELIPNLIPASFIVAKKNK
jgi:ubiquinone/menaquinone biosynthesis C-methylase UbiE